MILKRRVSIFYGLILVVALAGCDDRREGSAGGEPPAIIIPDGLSGYEHSAVLVVDLRAIAYRVRSLDRNVRFQHFLKRLELHRKNHTHLTQAQWADLSFECLARLSVDDDPAISLAILEASGISEASKRRMSDFTTLLLLSLTRMSESGGPSRDGTIKTAENLAIILEESLLKDGVSRNLLEKPGQVRNILILLAVCRS